MSIPLTPGVVAIIVACVLLVCVGFLCWLGTYGERVREIHLNFMQIIYSPVQQLATWCQDGRRCISAWLREQIAAESPDGRGHHVMWIFGGFIYAGLSAIFLYCDLGVLAQTFDSLGMPANLLPETDPGSLMAIATWAAPVAWGLFFFDALGVTHLAPWMHSFNPLAVKGFVAICVLELLIAIAALGLLSYYRADIIIHEMAPVAAHIEAPVITGSDDIDAVISQMEQNLAKPADSYVPALWVPLAAFCCAQLAIIPAAIVSVTGALPLFKWLILLVAALVTGLPLVIGGGILSLLQMVLERIVSLFEKILDTAIENGEALLRHLGWQPRERQPEATSPSGDKTATVTDSDEPQQEPAESKAEDFVYLSSSNGFDPMGVGQAKQP